MFSDFNIIFNQIQVSIAFSGLGVMKIRNYHSSFNHIAVKSVICTIYPQHMMKKNCS